ncbi:hypothetical protein [Sphingomonas adhaesiva]|uniref:hypothetical protein n=1 Tax=Sphingomonas adhaesiva TaxID=28212 RepID=UPI002FFC0087
MKSFAVFALASTIALPALASAQTAAPAAQASAGVSVGATVYDTSGGVVGTVDTTDGTNAVVNTGTVKAAIPLSSLGKGEKGPVLAMTKAQLEAAATQQQAQASADFKAKLVPGAAVYGTGGAQLGTIKSADASFVTVTTTSGDAKLPVAGFGPGPQGVTLGMTADQLKAAMGGAAATAPTASATAATEATATAATDTAAPAKKKK